MGKLGDKPDQPWSATTIGASVNGKPNPGATVKTVVGEIVDFSCYLEVGKHGDKHRDCAQKCFRNGQPIGLLTEVGRTVHADGGRARSPPRWDGPLPAGRD